MEECVCGGGLLMMPSVHNVSANQLTLKNCDGSPGLAVKHLCVAGGGELLFLCSHSCLYQECPYSVPFSPLVSLILPLFVTNVISPGGGGGI